MAVAHAHRNDIAGKAMRLSSGWLFWEDKDLEDGSSQSRLVPPSASVFQQEQRTMITGAADGGHARSTIGGRAYRAATEKVMAGSRRARRWCWGFSPIYL